MISFDKRERRFLDDTSTMPSNFLSKKIRLEIKNKLGFMPDNVYIGNAAGNYVFISIVAENGDVFTYTDCYNLDAELKNKGIDY